MNRNPVKSSNLKSVGYNASTQTLEVEFKNGAVWHYEGVPQAKYDDMIEAESIGSYFSHNIRGKFEGKSGEA